MAGFGSGIRDSFRHSNPDWSIDNVAEWLRRGPAKLVLFECACSNHVVVDIFFLFLAFFLFILVLFELMLYWYKRIEILTRRVVVQESIWKRFGIFTRRSLRFHFDCNFDLREKVQGQQPPPEVRSQWPV